MMMKCTGTYVAARTYAPRHACVVLPTRVYVKIIRYIVLLDEK